MFKRLIGVFGDSNKKQLDRIRPLVVRINELESQITKLSPAELETKANEFRNRYNLGESLMDLLPEAFACVRESALRSIGLRHYDEQLFGGVVLHQGKIAEMKTGEGKTLVATAPLFLNAISGLGAHLITVNDYLAKRDSEWMSPVYRSLGMNVACLQSGLSLIYHNNTISNKGAEECTKKRAYESDITYGTNNEFGFDYLRDNMILEISEQVQKPLCYGIVDEVDNILIDEARTPLIISGPAEDSGNLYATFARIAKTLKPDIDYVIEEKERSVKWTEEGQTNVVRILKVDPWGATPEQFDETQKLVYFLESAVKAMALYKKDREYVIEDGQIIIVDEFTGRLMKGRRFGDGLHQALEAKEGLQIRRENITYATITLQNYFRMYSNLAGMTGTAMTEAEEFWKIYSLDVVGIPTHEPMIREDKSDYIYSNKMTKIKAIVIDAVERNKTKQPILIGTVSIEDSEQLSSMLKTQGIQHEVLNAKYHEKEASIIAQAGKLSAVTVATNMAGRGTDIVLGGDPVVTSSLDQWKIDHEEVVRLGGLYIIGSERHESRRIDNQLRGRSGRQGDPGETRFYVSIEDDLIKRFGGDKIKTVLNMTGFGEEALESGLMTKLFESSQSRVEGYYFDIRKHLVDYDDVINTHRKIIYKDRIEVLEDVDLRHKILDMVQHECEDLIDGFFVGDDFDEEVEENEIVHEFRVFRGSSGLILPENITGMSKSSLTNYLVNQNLTYYQEIEEKLGAEQMRSLERLVLLKAIDFHWVHHLTSMSDLRQGIGLHGYGQRDPLVMYKIESRRLFDELQSRIRHDVSSSIMKGVASSSSLAKKSSSFALHKETQPSSIMSKANKTNDHSAIVKRSSKIGRNETCPCGSGKKFKKCHGSDT